MFAITNAKPYVPAVNLSTFVLSFTDGTKGTSHIFPTVEKLDCIFIIDARPFFGPQVKNDTTTQEYILKSLIINVIFI